MALPGGHDEQPCGAFALPVSSEKGSSGPLPVRAARLLPGRGAELLPALASALAPPCSAPDPGCLAALSVRRQHLFACAACFGVYL